MHYLNEQNIFIFLVQVFLLLGLARGLGELFRKWKQPPLTAEILVGIIFGPTVFGRFLPALHGFVFPKDVIQLNMFETVGWLGVLFLLLETGLEIDFSTAWKQRGDALKIAVSDIIIPMIVAFIPCLFLSSHYLANPDQRLIFALFMATAMTISAMPVAARTLHDLKLSKTDLGFLIMSALSVNDIMGWLLFTLVLGFFTQASLDVLGAGIIIVSTIGFAVACLTIGRRFADAVISKIKAKHMPQPGTSLTFICLLGLLCGAITQKIGIHALFGFFLAGIMAGGSKALSERTRQIISQMVYAIFVPLFFVAIGLKIDFFSNFDIFLVALVSIIGIAGRFLGAWIGTLFTELPRSNRVPIAIAHTPGGAMEIVVGILALEYGLITEPVFVAIVFGAVISSITLGPWLSHSIKARRAMSILECFSKRDIIADIKSENRDKAIMEICEMAGEHDDMPDIDILYSGVIERENSMGTAIEEGIAVPHARMSSLRKPVIAFGRSIAGIDWNSPDGKPTHLIFLVLSPLKDEEAQLQILRAIAIVMSNADLRSRLMKAEDAQELWSVLRDIFMSQNIIKK